MLGTSEWCLLHGLNSSISFNYKRPSQELSYRSGRTESGFEPVVIVDRSSSTPIGGQCFMSGWRTRYSGSQAMLDKSLISIPVGNDTANLSDTSSFQYTKRFGARRLCSLQLQTTTSRRERKCLSITSSGASCFSLLFQH